MREQHRSAKSLAATGKDRRSLPWRTWSDARFDAAQMGYQWPPYCWLPHGSLAAILVSKGLPLDQPGKSELAFWIATQSVLATWRVTQGIYRFDADVGLALACSPVTGPIPAATLRRLPEWGIYVEVEPEWLSVPDQEIFGFWACLDWHSTYGDELRIVLDCASGPVWTNLPLAEGVTVEQAFAQRQQEVMECVVRGERLSSGVIGGDDASKTAQQLFAGVVSLLLYLCAEPELRGQTTGAGAPPRRRQKICRKNKVPLDGERAKMPEIWEVAFRLGKAIREGREIAQSHDGRAGPRPHIRRAHWHSYWHGSGEERELRPRWLPPLLVAADDQQDEVQAPTLRRVDRGTRKAGE